MQKGSSSGVRGGRNYQTPAICDSCNTHLLISGGRHQDKWSRPSSTGWVTQIAQNCSRRGKLLTSALFHNWQELMACSHSSSWWWLCLFGNHPMDYINPFRATSKGTFFNALIMSHRELIQIQHSISVWVWNWFDWANIWLVVLQWISKQVACQLELHCI